MLFRGYVVLFWADYVLQYEDDTDDFVFVSDPLKGAMWCSKDCGRLKSFWCHNLNVLLTSNRTVICIREGGNE